MTDQEQGLPLEPEVQPETNPETPEESQIENKADEASKAADKISIVLPVARVGGAPSWVELPEDFKFPRGKQVLFLKFRSEWTDAPWKGEQILDSKGNPELDSKGQPVLYRQCVVWPINSSEKKAALNRANRDPNRAIDELALQMVRVQDGRKVDWTTAQENGIEMFWNEIGERCRGLLQRIFTQLHVLDTESTRDFLQNCIEVRSTGS